MPKTVVAQAKEALQRIKLKQTELKKTYESLLKEIFAEKDIDDNARARNKDIFLCLNAIYIPNKPLSYYNDAEVKLLWVEKILKEQFEKEEAAEIISSFKFSS